MQGASAVEWLLYAYMRTLCIGRRTTLACFFIDTWPVSAVASATMAGASVRTWDEEERDRPTAAFVEGVPVTDGNGLRRNQL